jgi:uncharacterized membrane protein YoaK (UPF0700 family)
VGGERFGVPGTESIRHPVTRALLVLTLTTGVIDAACFLGLGHVFAGNMTGNVLLLGFGIAGAAGLSVVGPAVSVVAFLLGAVVGGRIGFAAPAVERHLARAMLVEFAVVGLATLLAIAFDIVPGHFSGDAVIALVAFGMGVRNATVRRLKVPDISTVVVTSTMTALAADSPLAGGAGVGTARRAGVVVAMLVGATIGALLVKADLALVLAAAALLALASWLVLVPAAAGVDD